jgi:adenylosuccinate lyase
MGARITDSALYGHQWATEELREVFAEEARIQGWLDVLVALAEAQAELGIIPLEAARAIAANSSVRRLDLDFMAEETARTGHSTLGLIRALGRALPTEAREWVYYGATVQDVTDTWTALAMRSVARVVWRDLRAIEQVLIELAERHRDTIMAGRTHGQLGSAITFGLKAAGWADEIRRHLHRLRGAAPRLLVGQLGGGVGTLAFFGDKGPELRRIFCARLGLDDPGIAWLSARDRIAEFVHLLAMVAATLARVGNELYQLQRPEIDELREPEGRETVGSITMPHKRNPEVAEHLVTLSRLVRAQADVVLEGMVQEHERDGRGWKAEWVALPEACLLTGAGLFLTLKVLKGLEVRAEAMRNNLEPQRGLLVSENVLALLAPKIGKHRAQAALQQALQEARDGGLTLEEALAASEPLRAHADLTGDEPAWGSPNAGASGLMVDFVVSRARRERAAESDAWP